MDKLIVMLLGLAAVVAVCSSYPAWGNPRGSNYWMQQQQQRMRKVSPSRRPATIRSRLSLPVKPNTSVRHHVSVKNVPVRDGNIGIIKQTVLLKTPNANKGASNQRPTHRQPSPTKPRPTHRQPSPTLQSTRPAYRASPTARNNPTQGQGRAGLRGYRNGRNNKGRNNNGPNSYGPNGFAGNHNNALNNKGRNTGGPQSSGNQHTDLLPAISTLNKHLGSLIDVLRSKNGNGGLPPTTIDPLHLGTSIPTIVIVDQTGLGRGNMGGSGRKGHGQRGAGLGNSFHGQPGAGLGNALHGQRGAGLGNSLHGQRGAGLGNSLHGQRGAGFGNAIHDSFFNSNRQPRNGGSSFSSLKGSLSNILIPANGPNTKAIRITTKVSRGFTKAPGAGNSMKSRTMRNQNKITKPSVSTTPSGEDPPEVGELGEP